MSEKLPSEIVSLIHHVKLNESGWWEKAVQNLIISVFGIYDNAPLTSDELFDKVRSELQSGIDKTRFLKQFEILRGNQRVISLPNNLFVLSEVAYQDFSESLENQRKIETDAENRFRELSENLCPSMDHRSLWKEFNEQLLVPLIREIGAKTYQILAAKESMHIENYAQFQNFLKQFEDEKPNVEILLLTFLDLKNDAVKGFILRQLISYFFVEATNLNQQTVEMVYSLSKSQPNLKIFVDTNFLLTLLDLHDNPSNEATMSLVDLMNEIANKVKVKFYVLPITVSEFQNLISKFKDYLKNLKPTLNYAIAAENSNEFSGILKRYFQKCHQKGMTLNVNDYFDPYLDNFTVNMRNKGIEIYQDKMEKYSTDQRVINDLLEQVEYRFEWNKKSGKYKGSTHEDLEFFKMRIYDKFNHDCQLWHYVRDRRPSYYDSPKDVSHWILTLDFSFLEFDRYKQMKDRTETVSVCLHPNEFISMLQFWVPRTDKFERAILGNFRLPFFFREIDSESERVSVEILRALSQYEDNESFSSELVTEMLTNKALRQKIKPINSVEENAALIKEEIFKRYEIASRQLEEKKNENKTIKNQLSDVWTQLKQLNQKIDRLNSENNKKIERELQIYRSSKIRDAEHEKNKIEIRLKSLEENFNDIKELKKKAEAEVEISMKNPGNRFKSIFVGSNVLRQRLTEKIFPKLFDRGRFEKLSVEISETRTKLERFIIPSSEEKIIVYCENQNAIFFNQLGFSRIHFHPEKDSAGVFVKSIANQTCFGLRDRDYLTDEEISKLKTLYPNYLILKYYSFENYLYHPENMLELDLPNFSYDEYVQDLVKQKKNRFNYILTIYKSARNTYQEFRLPDQKIKDKNEEAIISYLQSNEVEIFFKSFSIKDFFDKNSIKDYNLTVQRLASTQWFRNAIQSLLSVHIQNLESKSTE